MARQYDRMQRRFDERQDRSQATGWKKHSGIGTDEPIGVEWRPPIRKYDFKVPKHELKAHKRRRQAERKAETARSAAAAEVARLRYKADDSYGAF